MRVAVCAIVVAIALAAPPALARTDKSAAAFWKAVQAKCDATARKPARGIGRRIARNAIDEFYRFGGHAIDSTGRLFHFGVTEAEHDEESEIPREAPLGQLGWWRVMKYWRALYGDDAAAKLEARGYRDASTSTQASEVGSLLRTNAAQLLRDADATTDPAEREILREAALRAAIIDTPWSAAFVSYVIKEAGATEKQFTFSNAHRAYIYDAFATSTAEVDGHDAGDRLYRACPLTATRPRPGDLICGEYQRGLAGTPAGALRERIRSELAAAPAARTVRRTHCDVVAYVDKAARKLYAISGNVYQSVTVRKLNLRGNLEFSPAQEGHCGGPGTWTLPPPSAGIAHPADLTKKCSLNDENWFVLLQVR
jgi:Uncharacterized protein conserved in bacteria (DUF2272)